jgi:predicted RNA-binding Zn-ribbon protein involved in translation (DUF1610 family)
MGLVPFSLPPDDPVIDRGCVRCGAVLDVTPEDELACPRCGRVRIWTVSVNGRVVAAGREDTRAGIGIWLAGELDDLLPASLRERAASRGGWNEED